uniref:PAN domain protein n=1 Tax=Marseillevirus LCMAC102 TaxID=2506603 RepID=A0A481YU49_9VIRU|nr:MAG: PAN domain protein [Marseillevirus LCMAC102]
MTTYEIIPETDLPGHDLSKILPRTSIATCRQMCNESYDCESFVLKDGTCILKKSSEVPTKYDSHATLYIKKGNSNFWVLWVFLIILGIIVFMAMCKRK